MDSNKISKILIANRGEIARRIIRACKELNIGTVVPYTKEEKDSLFVKEADEKVLLSGEGVAAYLDGDNIIQIAKSSGAQAIHPGYGFLSENVQFAQAVTDSGLIFIGPTPQTMKILGEKESARKKAIELGIPVSKGSNAQSIEEILKESKELKFPVLVKAVAGGGGRGMRLVASEKDLQAALSEASVEANAGFGDSRVFIEEYFDRARHIEVQLLGDGKGNVVHLFERDCTIQRRYQKILEESPAYNIPTEVLAKLYECSLSLGKNVKLRSAATVEFLVKNSNPYDFIFLEVNPRLQVEHPVTELVTGRDIVQAQIYIAEHHKLPFKQSEIKQLKSAVEVRVCAERFDEQSKSFIPTVGKIKALKLPEGSLRVEHALQVGDQVSGNFDSMIAKFIASGENRQEVLKSLHRALADTVIDGLTTNLAYLKDLLEVNEVLQGTHTTQFVFVRPFSTEREEIALLGYVGARYLRDATNLHSPLAGFRSWQSSWQSSWQGAVETKTRLYHPPEQFSYKNGTQVTAQILQLSLAKGLIQIEIALDEKQFKLCFEGQNLIIYNDQRYHIDLQDDKITLSNDEFRFVQIQPEVKNAGRTDRKGLEIISPLNGKISAVEVVLGQRVAKGDLLLVIESMKMQHKITASCSAIVSEIKVSVADLIKDGEQLLVLSEG
jgi:3-methylcrotonyl-CoA carboxylase alpha subunit